MTLDQFLALLDGVRRENGYHKARCPAHADDEASLSVRVLDDWITPHCFAGCDKKAILDALDVKHSDLCQRERPPRRERERERVKPTATYVYTDPTGKPLYRIVRLPPAPTEKKPFRTWGAKDKTRVLYRLHQLVAADLEEVILIPEGEKDCDNLVARGFTATCNPHGACKWLPEFSPYLKGRPVVLFEDNDEPGRKHVEQVGRALTGVAARIRVVTFRDLPEHSDVSDWLASHADCELNKLIDAAPIWQPSEAAAPTVEPSERSWRDSLTWIQTERGRHLDRTPGNLGLLLMHEDGWAGCLGYDELLHRATWTRQPALIDGASVPAGPVEDDHFVHVQHWFREHGYPTWTIDSVARAIGWAAQLRRYHPVRDYLRSLAWDGVPRVGTWLEMYFRNTAAPTAPVGKWWLISAVARAMRPGCQVDHMLVLEGPQGVGKSTAASILGGSWFSNEIGDLRDKDAAQSLAGVWLMELPELDAIRRADMTRVKSFVSTRCDHFRPSYGRNTVDRPRQCVFIGTTNEAKYLTDPSGGRRFWPVAVGPLDANALRRDRDQLWAEAVHLYDAGERWWPVGEEECSTLAATVEERYAEDPWERPIAEAMQKASDGRTIERLLAEVLGVDKSKQDRAAATRVGVVLARLGYKAERRTVDGVRVRVYVPGQPSNLANLFSTYPKSTPDKERKYDGHVGQQSANAPESQQSNVANLPDVGQLDPLAAVNGWPVERVREWSARAKAIWERRGCSVAEAEAEAARELGAEVQA